MSHTPTIDTISPQMIEDISNLLSHNQPVRMKLPPWGRIHLDRQLPFIGLYRRPKQPLDPGTERLLLGTASYLLAADTAPTQHSSLCNLIKEISYINTRAFGAFLILEIWAGKDRETCPTFRILAPEHQTPSRLLEAFENVLLDIGIENHQTTVAVNYGKHCAPPGISSLLTAKELAEMNAIAIGLEIKPIYRDSSSGALFPFKLRKLHHDLVQALKKVFYLFAHRYSRHRPAHYHELGQRAITKAVKEADSELANINRLFDVLLHVTPVNTQAAWNAFKKSRFEREPVFNYRARTVDPSLLKRQLYQIPLENIEDPTLSHVLTTKRDELERQLNLIQDRGTPCFLRGSQQIFGELEDSLVTLARDLLVQLPPHARDDNASHALDGPSFAKCAEQEMAYYRSQDPSFPGIVELRDDVPGLMVSQGRLLIGRDAEVPETRVAAALAHEAGTHALTYHNGTNQPLHQLSVGMANYEPLQEGLAVLAEYLVGGLSRPRLRLLAGRVLAVHCLTEGASFVDTFHTLYETYQFNQHTAYLMTMRVFRGGGFTKDAVYLKGLVDLMNHLARGGDLELLLLGKITLDFLPFIEELRWRKVLVSGPLRPRYLDRPEAAVRLERIRSGLSIVELAKASPS